MSKHTKVVVAQSAGACYGVERALRMVREAAQSGAQVHTLGPLIHNPQVVAELEAKGVGVVESPHQQPGSTLVLRTHGVTPEVERDAAASGVEVLDATCPYVKKAHMAAERFSREGYQVVVVGEKGHPEVEGTAGHAPGAMIVNSADQLDGAQVGRRVGVVVQTTQTKACLDQVVCRLLGMAEEVRVVNTICDATSERQAAAAQLAGESDAMVVIGGRNSANTTHLADICRAACPRTHHIETADELQAQWFAGAAQVGITAGASTPPEQIDAVLARVRALCDEEG